MIVLDTNVLSELLRPLPADEVLRWVAGLEPLSVFTTSITPAEVLYGIEILPLGKRRAKLSAAVDEIFQEFQDRILPFDDQAARLFPKIVAGRTAVGRPISQWDAVIAAIARSRHAILATRDIRDFEHCGLRLVSPWIERS